MLSRITDKLFIGDSGDAKNLDHLQEVPINGVLNVAFDLDVKEDYYHRGISAHKVGLIDGPGNKIGDYYAAVLKLDSLLKTKNQVMIHCHAGVSRSPFVTAVWMVASGLAGDFDDAVGKIADKRPCVSPSGAFFREYKLIDMALLRKLMTY
jgi:protein-tyrosine phosphatase